MKALESNICDVIKGETKWISPELQNRPNFSIGRDLSNEVVISNVNRTIRTSCQTDDI